MNFTEFKEMWFDGDKNKALQSLAEEMVSGEYKFTQSAKNLDEIVKSMDEKTANEFSDYVSDKMSEKIHKNKKEFKNAIKAMVIAEKLNLTKEELFSCERNPFTKKLLRDLLISAAIFGLFILVMCFSDDTVVKIVSSVLSIYTTLAAYRIAGGILKVIRFRKFKKMIDSEPGMLSALVKTEEEEVHTEEIPNNPERSSEQKKTLLTRMYVYDTLKQSLDNKFGMYAVLGGLLSVIFFAASFTGDIRAILMFIVCFTVSLVMSVKTKLRLKKLKNFRYRIVKDKCVNKQLRKDFESDSFKKYVFFEKYGKQRIDLSHKGVFTQNLHEVSLYDSIQIGDECLLVILESEDKSLMFVPADKFEFSENEFEFSDNVYLPVKDTSYAQILEKEKEKNQSVYSDRQNDAIENAAACAKKAKMMALILIFLTFLGAAWAFFGPMFLRYRLVYIAVQLLISVIPVIYAYVLIIRSKKAVDKVRTDYADYYNISKSHNVSSLLVFIFGGLQLFSCVLCYLFSFAT